MPTAPSIGRTLARLAALSSRPLRHGEVANDSRTQILQLIDSADEPVSVEWLSARTSLHPNTVRGHLEVLLAAGQIVRAPGHREGRGRPPMLYRSAEPEPSVYQDLVSTLVAQLGPNADSPLIQEAATKWADVVDRPAVATDIDMALDQAVSALDQLGFVARVSPVGDSITLASCPYADLIADQPVICDIHTALLQELLDRTGQPVSVAQMQVWAASGVCRSRLSRPDRRPARVIDVAATDDERAVAGSQAATSPVADPGERGGSGNGKNGNAKSKAGFGKKGTSA